MTSSDHQLSATPQMSSKSMSRGVSKSKSATNVASRDVAPAAALSVLALFMNLVCLTRNIFLFSSDINNASTVKAKA